MADTLVKKPKLIVGTQSQVEAEMGANDIGFATDIEFYTKTEVDDEILGLTEYVGTVESSVINAQKNITQLSTNIQTVAGWVNAKDESGNRAVLETEAQDAYRAINELNAKISEGGGASLPILMPVWSDHLLNDVSWLRADTFSWQSGDVYKAAYEHLASELTEVQTMYGWENEKSTVVYTYSATPKAGDPVVDANGTQKDTVVSSTASVLTTTGSYSGTSQWDRYSSYDKQLDLAKTDTIGDITISYYLAEDGHKICTPDQESNIVALYKKTGAADYYLLDTTNKQFKLPRKQKRTLIQAVKNTDGTWYNLYSDGWVEQGGELPLDSGWMQLPVTMNKPYAPTFKIVTNRTGVSYDCQLFPTDAQADKFYYYQVAPEGGVMAQWEVKGYAAESAYASAGMRLEYYYVGNFEQTAVEQTAGLNAEMFNGKADVSRVEVLEGYDYVVESQSPTADNGYTWYRKYKSGWVEQGGKLSGRNITFPIQFSLLPTVGTSIVNSDTNVVANNHISNIKTTGFDGFATSMNAGWTGPARDMNGYWTAFGFATQE